MADTMAKAVDSPISTVARPEVEGPNTFPTNGRFRTSTENYAAGGPPTPTVTESAKRARKNLQAD